VDAVEVADGGDGGGLRGRDFGELAINFHAVNQIGPR
jgi:hypothetical protein